jgi:hypothetical protein
VRRAAAGYGCGSLFDGCSTTLDCGQCNAPDTCGGGGTAHKCGHRWSIESVGTLRTNDQIDSRVVVDSTGRFHVVIFDRDTGDVRLASFDTGGTAVVETVAAGTHNGNYPGGGGEGLAVDLWNQIHVTYQANWDLHHAQKYGNGTWGDDAVETSTGVFGTGFGGSSAVTTDGTGGAHIVYTDGDAPAMRYAYRPAGGSWQTQLLDGAASSPGSCSLAIDASGGLHALYDSAPKAVSYANRPAGGAWSAAPIGAPTDAIFMGGFALGGDGGLHYLAFHGSGTIGADEPLVYGYRPAGGGWSFDQVAVADTGGEDTQNLVIGPDGHLHHVERWQDGIVHAERTPTGAWTSETLSFQAKSNGLSISEVFDAAGGLHVVYVDENHDLQHAYRKPVP